MCALVPPRGCPGRVSTPRQLGTIATIRASSRRQEPLRLGDHVQSGSGTHAHVGCRTTGVRSTGPGDRSGKPAAVPEAGHQLGRVPLDGLDEPPVLVVPQLEVVAGALQGGQDVRELELPRVALQPRLVALAPPSSAACSRWLVPAALRCRRRARPMQSIRVSESWTCFHCARSRRVVSLGLGRIRPACRPGLRGRAGLSQACGRVLRPDPGVGHVSATCGRGLVAG